MAKYNVVVADEVSNTELAFEIETPLDNLTIFSTIVQGDFSKDAIVIVKASKPLSLTSDDQISIEALLEVNFNFRVQDYQVIDSDQEVTFDVTGASNCNVTESLLDVILNK